LELLFSTLLPFYWREDSTTLELQSVDSVPLQNVEKFIYEYSVSMIQRVEKWMKLSNRNYCIIEDIEQVLFFQQKSCLPSSWIEINQLVVSEYECSLVEWLQEKSKNITKSLNPTIPESSPCHILWPVCNQELQKLITKDGKRTVPYFHSPCLEWLPVIPPPIHFQSNEQSVYQYLEQNQIEDFKKEESKLNLYRNKSSNPTKSILDLEEEQNTVAAKSSLVKSVDISHITKLRKQQEMDKLKATARKIISNDGRKPLYRIIDQSKTDSSSISIVNLNSFSESFLLDDLQKEIHCEYSVKSEDDQDNDNIINEPTNKKMKITSNP